MLTHTNFFVTAQNCDKSVIYVPSYLILLSTLHGSIMIIFIFQVGKFRLRELKESAQGQLPRCLTPVTFLYPSTTRCLHREQLHTPDNVYWEDGSSIRQCSWDFLQITWHLEQLSNLPSPLPFLSFAQEIHFV